MDKSPRDTEEDLESRIPASNLLQKLSYPEYEFRIAYADSIRHKTESLPDNSILKQENVLPLYVSPLEIEEENPIKHLREVDRINQSQNVFLLGNPGTGKTVYLKRKGIAQLDDESRIPVYVHLGSYKGQDLEQYILENIGFPDFKWTIRNLLRKGGFEILLDGLDEITDHSFREKLIEQLNSQESLSKNRFIITGRPEVYSPTIRGFDKYLLEPATERDLVHYLTHTKSKDGNTYEGLCKEISKDKDTLEICRNPLLLGFVMELYDQKKGRKKDKEMRFNSKLELYDNIIKGRFLSREKDRQSRNYGKDSPDNPSDEILFMEEMAFVLHTNGSTLEDVSRSEEEDFVLPNDQLKMKNYLISRFPEGWDIKRIFDSIDKSGLCTAPMVLIGKHEGGLIRAKENYKISFEHRTIQEYFCARWFAREIKEGKLSVKEAYEQYWSQEEKYEQIRNKTFYNWDTDGDKLVPSELSKKLKDGRTVDKSWKEVLRFLAGMLDASHLPELLEVITESYFMNKSVFNGLGLPDQYREYCDDLFFSIELSAQSAQEIDKTRYVDSLIQMIACKDLNVPIAQSIGRLGGEKIAGFLTANAESYKWFEIDGGDLVRFFQDRSTIKIRKNNGPVYFIQSQENKSGIDERIFEFDISYLLALWNNGHDKALAFLEQQMPEEEFPHYKHVPDRGLELLAEQGNAKAKEALKAIVYEKINMAIQKKDPSHIKPIGNLLVVSTNSHMFNIEGAGRFVKEYLESEKRSREQAISYLHHIGMTRLLMDIVLEEDDPHREMAFQTLLNTADLHAFEFVHEYIQDPRHPYRIDMNMKHMRELSIYTVFDEPKEIFHADIINKINYFKEAKKSTSKPFTDVNERVLLSEIARIGAMEITGWKEEAMEFIKFTIQNPGCWWREELIRSMVYFPYSELVSGCASNKQDPHNETAAKVHDEMNDFSFVWIPPITVGEKWVETFKSEREKNDDSLIITRTLPKEEMADFF